MNSSNNNNMNFGDLNGNNDMDMTHDIGNNNLVDNNNNTTLTTTTPRTTTTTTTTSSSTPLGTSPSTPSPHGQLYPVTFRGQERRRPRQVIEISSDEEDSSTPGFWNSNSRSIRRRLDFATNLAVSSSNFLPGAEKKRLRDELRRKVSQVREALMEMEDLVRIAEKQMTVYELVCPNAEFRRCFQRLCPSYQDELKHRRRERDERKKMLRQLEQALDEFHVQWDPSNWAVDIARLDYNFVRYVEQPRMSLQESLVYLQSHVWDSETEYKVDMNGLLDMLLERYYSLDAPQYDASDFAAPPSPYYNPTSPPASPRYTPSPPPSPSQVIITEPAWMAYEM